MEIHQLRYFVAVAELENFTRAAEQCHVTQPSLSQQIAKLERELDTRLLDRLGRTVVLTDSGKELLPRARRILKEVDAAQGWFQQPEGPEVVSLRVGALPTIAPFKLPTIVAVSSAGVSTGTGCIGWRNFSFPFPGGLFRF